MVALSIPDIRIEFPEAKIIAKLFKEIFLQYEIYQNLINLKKSLNPNSTGLFDYL
tara:strand:+ start:4417 stop:4581 length:165 start_codon:yes stop_codon:yes gene_type:complete